MQRNQFLALICIFFILSISSCQKSKKDTPSDSVVIIKNKVPIPIFTQKEGVLKVLMDNSLTSYFINKGQAMGFEYEMLDLFAKENDLKLEIKVIYNLDNILDSLVAGKGDLVAANLAISKPRMEMVSFCSPLFRTRQILVQRLPENRLKMTADNIEKSLIRDRLDLAGKEVVVRKNSSYELTLTNLINETGLDLEIKYAESDLVTEQLIDMVSNSEIDYTICDLNKAKVFNAYYDNIDIQTPISLSQSISWAVNKESTALLEKLNLWIEKRSSSLEFNVITNRYFEMNKRKERIIAKGYEGIKGGKISPFDEIIKEYATKLDWDWRLLTSLIFKESQFDPKTKSWAGAMGLMQVMPRTARSYGVQVNELYKPRKNIDAGTKHLLMLENHWKKEITDSLEIVKFTLGSYNVGLGHVQDAQRLTEKYGLDTKTWDDNVAQMLLNKSIPKYYKDPVVKYGYCRGKEPVNYVEVIFENYQLYTQFTN